MFLGTSKEATHVLFINVQVSTVVFERRVFSVIAVDARCRWNCFSTTVNISV